LDYLLLVTVVINMISRLRFVCVKFSLNQSQSVLFVCLFGMVGNEL